MEQWETTHTIKPKTLSQPYQLTNKAIAVHVSTEHYTDT